MAEAILAHERPVRTLCAQRREDLGSLLYCSNTFDEQVDAEQKAPLAGES